MKRRLSLSLYHYLLTAGLSSGQISKSICPRFHSENREKEKEEIKGELSFSQRKGGGRKRVICRHEKERNTQHKGWERNSSFLREKDRDGN